MTDPRPEPAAGTGPGGPPGMPRWVKMAAILVGLLILLFLVLQLTGIGRGHGPGMHNSSGSSPASGSTALLAADE